MNRVVVLSPDELKALVMAGVCEALEGVRDTAARPALLDREQLASALQISLGTLAKLRRDGLPELAVGDSPRFDLEEVLAWLRARRGETSNGDRQR
ncbi:MAG: helix-turn-helix domain-containing protein [Myxococcales bacterium]|nr:helix-turn-helix domain-containing protein [Myxococcales bacterium]